MRTSAGWCRDPSSDQEITQWHRTGGQSSRLERASSLGRFREPGLRRSLSYTLQIVAANSSLAWSCDGIQVVQGEWDVCAAYLRSATYRGDTWIYTLVIIRPEPPVDLDWAIRFKTSGHFAARAQRCRMPMPYSRAVKLRRPKTFANIDPTAASKQMRAV